MALRRTMRENDATVEGLARALGVRRPHVSRILGGSARITPRIALALERAGLGDAWKWAGAQAEYDLWARRKEEMAE